LASKILQFIISNWKLMGLLILVGILFFWIDSKAGISKKLWEATFGGIKQDQAWIEKDLVSEINRLDDERENLNKKITLLQADKEKLKVQNVALDAQRCELEARLSALVVPTDIPAIVGEFRKLGLQSATARNLP